MLHLLRDASNCARFVTSTLIASINDQGIKKKLKKSQFFTPSTVGNVVISSTKSKVYEVTSEGVVGEFKSTVSKENRKYFLDRLHSHQPNFIGTLEPKTVDEIHNEAQWLSGIAAGAWHEFTFHESLEVNEFRFRRISPYGNIDVDAVFSLDAGFLLEKKFKVIHYSNCLFCTVKQNDNIYVLNYIRDF